MPTRLQLVGTASKAQEMSGTGFNSAASLFQRLRARGGIAAGWMRLASGAEHASLAFRRARARGGVLAGWHRLGRVAPPAAKPKATRRARGFGENR